MPPTCLVDDGNYHHRSDSLQDTQLLIFFCIYTIGSFEFHENMLTSQMLMVEDMG